MGFAGQPTSRSLYICRKLLPALPIFVSEMTIPKVIWEVRKKKHPTLYNTAKPPSLKYLYIRKVEQGIGEITKKG